MSELKPLKFKNLAEAAKKLTLFKTDQLKLRKFEYHKIYDKLTDDIKILSAFGLAQIHFNSQDGKNLSANIVINEVL